MLSWYFLLHPISLKLVLYREAGEVSLQSLPYPHANTKDDNVYFSNFKQYHKYGWEHNFSCT